METYRGSDDMVPDIFRFWISVSGKIHNSVIWHNRKAPQPNWSVAGWTPMPVWNL
jgi:hypothetical protein